MKKSTKIKIAIIIIDVICLIGCIIFFCLRNVLKNQDMSETDFVQQRDTTDKEFGNTIEYEAFNSTENVVTNEELQIEKEALSEEENNKNMTILFTGDVYLDTYFLDEYNQQGIQGMVSNDLLETMSLADVLMINNEFPFGTTGNAADKEYAFEVHPQYVSILKDMSVDIAGLANNHCLDYGHSALQETFDLFDKENILYTGAGNSYEEASTPIIIEHGEKRIGFLAVSRVVPDYSWDVTASTPGVLAYNWDASFGEVIRSAKQQCDYLFVFPHWGEEREIYPNGIQKEMARLFVENGADAVIGAHSHCLQGIEYIDNKPVFYSLGNFIFSYTVDQSAILKVTISADGNLDFNLVPVYTNSAYTYQADGEKKQQIIDTINQLSINAYVDEDGVVTYKE